jgi:hypothetical protein
VYEALSKEVRLSKSRSNRSPHELDIDKKFFRRLRRKLSELPVGYSKLSSRTLSSAWHEDVVVKLSKNGVFAGQFESYGGP